MARRASAARAVAPEGDERALIEAAQHDPRRFADLYETHFEREYAFIVRRVADRDLAQDLTADVFQNALASLSRFEWRGVPFSAWLFRIAANAIADRHQRAARERHLPPPEPPEEVSAEDVEERARLFQLVERLPSDQRRVIVMRFAEQKSIREIAAALQRTEGAIKQLQFRGLDNLRARIGALHG